VVGVIVSVSDGNPIVCKVANKVDAADSVWSRAVAVSPGTVVGLAAWVFSKLHAAKNRANKRNMNASFLRLFTEDLLFLLTNNPSVGSI
jgi:hypothetical protein